MIRDTIVQRMTALVKESSRDELLWLSGYVAGLTSVHNNAKTEVANGITNGSATNQSVSSLTVLYGTETGNAKAVATKVVAAFKQSNKSFRVRLIDVAQYDPNQLQYEENIAVVISTQGDGEPPVNAKRFYDYLKVNQINFSKLNFSVLALGSTAYPLFCQTGIEIDEWLDKAGAKRLLPLVKCDEDYEDEATKWMEALIQVSLLHRNKAANKTLNSRSTTAEKEKRIRQTVTAIVQVNTLLNERGAQRQTHHLELMPSSPFDFTPGDAVGVVPHNPYQLVESILSHSELSGATMLTYRNEAYQLQHLLSEKLNLSFLPLRTVEKYASLVGCQIPATRMSFYDLLRIYPVKDKAQFMEAIALLDPIAPRLYTIASSPAAHNGQLHLTVLRLPIYGHGEEQYGLCSNYLCQLPIGTPVNVFLHRHKHFALPADDQDMIMIGPGTGIAPFRSFVAERDATGAGGRNWLFFDEPDFVNDFYYQTEWQAWYETGVLNKISLAWHNGLNDVKRVHQSIVQEGAEFWNWVSNGAYIFISGEKDPMSKQVEEALLSVFQDHGKMNEAAAANFLKDMMKAGKYAKDVY